MAKKELKYKPSGNSIGMDTGIIQAARLIDMAAINATRQSDTDGMLRAADAWLKLTTTVKDIMSASEGSEDDDCDDEDMGDRSRSGTTVGFTATVKEMRKNNERIKNLPEHD